MTSPAITIQRLTRDTERRLSELYSATDAQWLVRIAFEEIKGWDRTQMLLHADDETSEFLVTRIGDVVGRLMRYEPIQYIFGSALFYGMKLKVNRSTLIPRPETARLVDIIVDRYSRRSDLNVMDICTGSGCIAIALARNLPFCTVTATDISAEALDVAKENAANLKTKINFQQSDILKVQAPPAPLYDIIVSNPPYVACRERAAMSPNVLDYEPATALFVPDNDPLLFYRHISRYAAAALLPGGRLYFEINPDYTAELRETLAGNGFIDIEILPDDGRLDRFAIATKPSDANR